MNKKVFIISFIMTIIATVVMSPLYLHHEFWKNWDEKRAQIEFFNKGEKNNSLLLNKASKAVKVSYPDNLKNNGQGMLMSFKVGPFYRQQHIVFESQGDGRLFVNFRPKYGKFSRLENLKTGQIEYRNILLGTQKIETGSGFIKDLKDGEKVFLFFEAKKIFDIVELFRYIDWLMFIIVISLNFFVMFLFVRYLVRLKVIKKASRIDIVFFISFLFFLILPLSNVSEDTVSEQENRVFSVHPRFFSDNTFNYDYGKQFEQWFNDRFFGRDWLIDFYNKVQNIIGGKGNKKVMIGRQDWLYIADSSAVSMYQNMNLFSENELKIAGDKMQNFVEEANKHGIKDVYFYLSPDKETLYPEFYPSYITKQGDVSRLQQLLKFLRDNYPQLKVLNFTDKLLKIKESGELIFCKTGSHMSGMGGFYEYLFFMKTAVKDYPDLKILDIKNMDIHEAFDCDVDLYRMLNDKRYSQENAYNKTVIVKNAEAVVTDRHQRFNKSIGNVTTFENESANNHLSVLFVSDSFGSHWVNYLAESFSSVYHIFNAHGVDYTYFDDELAYLKEHTPDIIIVETAERFLQRFLNLEFPKI